nr:hypothetical protein StreXyl84_40570 [Streptomyces sp. Xyl84]
MRPAPQRERSDTRSRDCAPGPTLPPATTSSTCAPPPTAARAWLAEPHTVKNIGATYPGIADAPQIRLTQTHDVLIHVHQVQAAHMLN